MSLYTDIYNDGVAAYNVAAQDKAAADALIPGFYNSINNWKPFVYSSSSPGDAQMQQLQWHMAIEGAVSSLSAQITYQYQKMSLNINQLQLIVIRANNALNYDKAYPDTLTNEESANLTSGIAALNDMIAQLRATQNSLNSVSTAMSAKLSQIGY